VRGRPSHPNARREGAFDGEDATGGSVAYAPGPPVTASTRTRGFSLRAKWTTALLAAAMLPLVALAWATLVIQRRGLVNAEEQLEVSVIDHVTSELNATLDDAAEATHRVGRLLSEPGISDAAARLELMQEAMARAEILGEVAIYGADGAYVDAIRRKDRKGLPPAPTKIPEAARSTEASGTWLPVEWRDGAAIVRYAEPIVRDGERRGFVLGTLPADVLGARLLAISKDRFDQRADGVILLDRDTRVLAGGGEAAAGGAEGARELAVGSTLAGHDLLAKTATVGDAFASSFASSGDFVSASGERMMGSIRSIPARRWALVVRRPESAVFRALDRTRGLLLRAAGVLALLVLAIGAFLGARTVRPVKALVRLAQSYGRRELDARSDVKTGDELEQLGDAMTEMAGHIVAGEREITRRTVVEANLSRYLPLEVAESIAKGEGTIALGGERRSVTVLFADVVSFTPFAESAPPEKVVAFLNELFDVLTEVVFRHGGTVDKFMGDCIMAVFGAPSALDGHAAKALAAAEDMHRFVETSAPEWQTKYGFDVKLAIGVSTGEVLVGNLGSETRMEYTAIGDVVNVAARLEAIARPAQTLVTADVAAAAKDAGFEFASLGEHPLRGKQRAVEILEVS
jgi:class 3 adenylate cyclase